MNRLPYINFDNTYVKLSSDFYTEIKPRVPSNPSLIKLNSNVAHKLGIPSKYLKSSEGLNFLSGSKIIDGSEPIATVYAGHQFGYFSPQLGDGRAILLGEVVGDKGRYDIQLKGSGRTPYSRGGDGNAALGPVLREYIISEAMNAIGIPTTRSLAAILTGDKVIREDVFPGALLVRVASSHIRVGTFEFFASRGQYNEVRALANYSIERHFPELKNNKDKYLGLLNAVSQRQAELIAQWMSFGFIHGVMNTDNMTICGETIDYGPCAFMDEYNPDQVFSSIDHSGRYKYSNQPKVAPWNLSRLAETLLPLIADKPEEAVQDAQKIIERFSNHYDNIFRKLMIKKIGISPINSCEEPKIFEHAQTFLEILKAQKADFTNSFRSLTNYLNGTAIPKDLNTLAPSEELKAWIEDWKLILKHHNFEKNKTLEILRSSNPFIIPRNHQVEKSLLESIQNYKIGITEFKSFERLVKASLEPFKENLNNKDLCLPPKESEKIHETFCGT